MDIKTLEENTLLTRLSIGGWSARKVDKKATQDAVSANDAQMSAGRFNKVLLESPALKRWHSHSHHMRQEHYRLTLPWSDTGERILSKANFDKYRAVMRDLQHDARGIADEFAADYDAARERAKKRLGKLFNETDYPPVSHIVNKFTVAVRLTPIPTNNDWRVDLGDEAIKELKQGLEEQYQDMLGQAVNDVWQRIYDLLVKFQERMDDPDKSFNKSMFGNAQDLVELLPGLNITNDPHLTKLTEEMRLQIVQRDVETVRHDPAERAEVHKSVTDMLSSMSSFYKPQEQAA